ncbi:sensor domain-containing diguanylate cyclase [Sphingomonas sanxanigenens]|uniref:sensor domain-containing diguanylate cyclase n=1 Tax=Sphingomonas sanxanigenens TaxID=397260 RepID=UPI001B80D0F0|nr:sensor domain-containing diguanylate cyclase [Sphingomonas sanxanigenens]
MARDLDAVQRIVRSVARELTGADGATFVLNDGGDFCHYADEDAIAPLWKGHRFPQQNCISGWVMRNRQPAVIPDIYQDERIPHAAYRPTFVKSMVMVPIRTIDPVGAIGNYWAQEHQPTATDVTLLQALADVTSVAMENISVYAELEDRVRMRTEELVRAHDEIQLRAITDDLTGLLNRRGFYEVAQAALGAHLPVLIAYIDADGLKQVNDRLGHAAGDAMLTDLADVLRSSVRASDIVARMGGDEFCVMMIEPEIDGDTLRARLVNRIDSRNATAARDYRLSASVGCIAVGATTTDDLDHWLVEADRRMYAEKAARRMQRH